MFVMQTGWNDSHLPTQHRCRSDYGRAVIPLYGHVRLWILVVDGRLWFNVGSWEERGVWRRHGEQQCGEKGIGKDSLDVRSEDDERSEKSDRRTKRISMSE